MYTHMNYVCIYIYIYTLDSSAALRAASNLSKTNDGWKCCQGNACVGGFLNSRTLHSEKATERNQYSTIEGSVGQNGADFVLGGMNGER